VLLTRQCLASVAKHGFVFLLSAKWHDYSFIHWKCQIQFTLSHVNWNLGMAYLRWNRLLQDLVAGVLPHYFLLFYECSKFCYSFEHEQPLRSMHFGCLILVICLSNALNCYNLFFTLCFSNSIMHVFLSTCA